jgi:hypothetical protein
MATIHDLIAPAASDGPERAKNRYGVPRFYCPPILSPDFWTACQREPNNGETAHER